MQMQRYAAGSRAESREHKSEGTEHSAEHRENEWKREGHEETAL
jgi:hypothetical protein